MDISLQDYANNLAEKGVKYAVFDIDNTITKSNILQFYHYIQRRRMNCGLFFLWNIYFVVESIYCFFLDRYSRGKFVKFFFKRFYSFSVLELESYASDFFIDKLIGRIIPGIPELIKTFKENDVEVILLSGTIEPLVKQYAHHFNIASYECARIKQKTDGLDIDFIDVKSFKENYIKKFDPALTVSVGDSIHDLPVLQHTHNAIIVTKNTKAWMKKVSNPYYHIWRE